MRLPPTVLAAALLPLSGCCSLARLFCGPDRSAWVQIDYSSPELAVRTLLEAIRRDEPQVVYDALAERYRKQLGLSQDVAELAWQRIKEQTPGLHLAGYADVPAPVQRSAETAAFVLDIEGQHLAVDVVRESFWEIAWVQEKGLPRQQRRALGGNQVALQVEPVADPERYLSRLVQAPVVFEHEGEEAVPLERVERAGLVRRWKIADIRQQAP